MILAKLEDTVWKKQAIAEVRHTVRVIAVNDHDEYAFCESSEKMRLGSAII